MTVKIGFIGTGGIASHHLTNLVKLPNATISALCDIDETKVTELAATYHAKPFTDHIQMLDETPLDLIFICTPPSIRHSLVEAVASRGIACFIEKPPAKTMAEGIAISDQLSQSTVINGVGFMFRYAKAVQKAKELLTGLQVPIVKSTYVCGAALNPDMPKWFFNKTISGGPLLDQAIHIFDLCRYLVCDQSGNVTALQAFGSNVTVPKTEDFTIEDSHIINLQYEKGTIHSHVHSWSVEKLQATIELIGKEYHLIIDLNPSFDGTALTGHINNKPISYHYENDNFYETEMKALLDAIQTNDQSNILSTYADATKTLQVTLAANESVENTKLINLNYA